MKPTPPDQTRIELVINGEDPESHKSAQETARILSAPQIARTVQKQIEECRQRIQAVSKLIIKSQSFNYKARLRYSRYNDNSDRDNSRDPHVTFDEILAIAPNDKLSQFIDLATKINQCHSALEEGDSDYSLRYKYVPKKDGFTFESMIQYHTQLAVLLTAYLPELGKELEEHKSNLAELLAIVKGK